MNTELTQLKAVLAEIHDLERAASLLAWDQQTNMPPGGAKWRSYQLSTLEKLAHEKFIASEVGKLLDQLEPYAGGWDPDSDDARLIKVTRREYEKNSKVPPEFVADFVQATTMAFQVWEEARAENDFSKFAPHLEKIVELRRRYANFFTPYGHIYDPLLDDFEPGLKTGEVKKIFDALRPHQVDLIQSIAERPQVDNSFIHQSYDERKQWDFGVEVITRFGFDWKRGRQDKSVHPFTTSFAIDDVRITTRLNPNNLRPALFGTMHETGHALYDLGFDPALARTPLASGASLGVHESQSRLWENLVGRSLPFWEFFYPRLQEVFPNQLKNVDLETFYKGINKVEPSLIRVESDEATYNLHIMLRLELEIALIEGSLEVNDLPEAWNTRMEEYLGVVPPNDALGVLQDIHWSTGMIGYFSTYTLGNLISLQLWECIESDIPELSELVRSGEFTPLLDWLKNNIHKHGAKYEPQELVQKVTGSKIDPNPYMKYLQTKYGDIYGL